MIVLSAKDFKLFRDIGRESCIYKIIDRVRSTQKKKYLKEEEERRK
jgi:hypothetical protein